MPVPRRSFSVPAPIGAVVVSYGLDKSVQPTMRGTTRCCPTACNRSRRCSPRSCATPIPMGWISRRGWAPTRSPSCRCRGCWTPAAIPISRSAWSTPARDPVTCASWSKPAGAATSSLTLLSGSGLPVPEAVHTVDLVGAGGGGTATRVALAPGTGYFTQTVGQGAAVTGHRVAVLGLRHRCPLRHRQRGRRCVRGGWARQNR